MQLEVFLGALAVFMVEQRVVDHFHQAQRAHVADAGEIAVAHAIQDREAEAHERDVFHARNVFAVGVADDAGPPGCS